MKGLIFVGRSLDDLKRFPEAARRLAGFELSKVQHGLEPLDWKPISSVGPGVREIRIHHEGEWRVVYVATLPNAVYVLHAFARKSTKTRQSDLWLARTRFNLPRNIT